MDRETILAGIHEVLGEIIPKYNPAPVQSETLVINVSAEVDSLTINEFILGLEDRFEMDEIEPGTITSATTISDVIDMIVASG